MIALKILLVLMTSITATMGNSLLKVGASGGNEDELLELKHLPRTLLKPAIIGGGALYAFSQLLWISILRIADLSLAYPLMIGLNFLLIMFVAWSYFKEPVSPGKLAGMVLIFIGIMAIAMG
ncbi:MAG: DMT family transporter [Thermoleophilia bacterium]